MATRIMFNVKCVMPTIENKKLHNFFFSHFGVIFQLCESIFCGLWMFVNFEHLIMWLTKLFNLWFVNLIWFYGFWVWGLCNFGVCEVVNCCCLMLLFCHLMLILVFIVISSYYIYFAITYCYHSLCLLLFLLRHHLLLLLFTIVWYYYCFVIDLCCWC
jgi:hypothetical protein